MEAQRSNTLLTTYAERGDPFAFLVVEQLVKERTKDLIPSITPLQYLSSHKRLEYDAGKRRYIETLNICNQLWAELVFRLMQLQVEDTLLPYELAYKRKVRAEQHKDHLQELHYQHEIMIESQKLEAERLPNMEAAHQQKMGEIRSAQAQLDLAEQSQLARDVARANQMNETTLNYQRKSYEKITASQLKLTHKHNVRLKQLEQEFEIELARVTPDKTDPAYKATRQSKALDIYIEKQRKIWEDETIDDDQRHQEIKLVQTLGNKI